MKKLSYLLALASLLVATTLSVRIGALILAAALALFVSPEIRNLRPIERLFPVAFIVSLITVALALPRR